MASPAAVDVGDALDDLINQFSDPMSFFRELIQNALDAGSAEVEVGFEFEPSAEDPERGAMVVEIADFGEGMDREIIDTKLTRLFSSAKDGDMTKIGKFGIGFVSVFAIKPDAVCVDTARAGEGWRVLFDRERGFKRLRLDGAFEGTTIRIIKTSSHTEFEAFVIRAKQVISYWCRHARGEVWVSGELISEPLGIEASLQITYKDDSSHVFMGHQAGAETLHGFFNGGLTLVQADARHPSAIRELTGISFKVSSRYLEHTLTRDDVIQDRHFKKVRKRLLWLAEGALRDEVFTRLDARVREGLPSVAGPEAQALADLYRAASWHLQAGGGVSRRHAALACARSPGGRVWTWSDLGRAIERSGSLCFASGATPTSHAIESEERAAVVASFGGASEGEHGSLLVEPNRALVSCVTLLAALDDEDAGPPRWACDQWFQPLSATPPEERQWAPLGNMLARLLDDTDHEIKAVRFARFAASGSRMGKRVAISQREFGELTPLAEAGELAQGLFSRRRVLVVDADHPTVRTLLGLAQREPELAAYQLAKLFLLVSGSIPASEDAHMVDVAMGYRETRCPKPLS